MAFRSGWFIIRQEGIGLIASLDVKPKVRATAEAARVGTKRRLSTGGHNRSKLLTQSIHVSGTRYSIRNKRVTAGFGANPAIAPHAGYFFGGTKAVIHSKSGNRMGPIAPHGPHELKYLSVVRGQKSHRYILDRALKSAVRKVWG